MLTNKVPPSLGNTKKMVLCALFIALSIIFGKVLSFTVGPFRFSLENLTLLMAGIFLGPIWGLLTGAAADLIGCILVGYAINPIITVGAASIGLIAGLMAKKFPVINHPRHLLYCIAPAHIIGSMLIKSVGLFVYYHFPLTLLLLRIPLYLVIGTVEGYLIYLLTKNRSFVSQFEGVQQK